MIDRDDNSLQRMFTSRTFKVSAKNGHGGRSAVFDCSILGTYWVCGFGFSIES